jgi:selenide,water dikinase
VQQGILSTLHPANIRCSQAVANLDAAHIRDSAVFPLLFDPQTAGGLLATVPRAHVPALIAALHKGGYAAAAVVGEVVSRSDDSDFAPLVHLKA